MPIYAYGKKLKDINGNIVYPVTRSNLVYTKNNMTVEEVLGQFIPPVEKNKDLTSEMMSKNYFYKFFGYGNDGYGNFIYLDPYNSSNRADVAIKLDKNYKVKTVGISLFFQNPPNSNPSLEVFLYRYKEWPQDVSSMERIDYLGSGSVDIYGYNGSINVDVSDYENTCIVVSLSGVYGTGNFTVTAQGDKNGQLPVIQKSNFYSQKCITDTIDGRPNPFKDKTLEAILLDLNKKVVALKK